MTSVTDPGFRGRRDEKIHAAYVAGQDMASIAVWSGLTPREINAAIDRVNRRHSATSEVRA